MSDISNLPPPRERLPTQFGPTGNDDSGKTDETRRTGLFGSSDTFGTGATSTADLYTIPGWSPDNPSLVGPIEVDVLPEEWLGGQPPAQGEPAPVFSYEPKVSEAVQKLVDDGTITAEQGEELRAALLLGHPPPSEPLKGLYWQVEDLVIAEMLAEYPELNDDWRPNSARAHFREETDEIFKGTLEETLHAKAQELGLTDEQIARLRFGLYNPDLADRGDRQLINEIWQEAVTDFKSQFYLPEGFVPGLDESGFMGAMANDADEMFQEGLAQYALDNNLSEREVNQLRYAYYHPEDSHDSQTLSALDTITNSYQSRLQEKWGTPSDYVHEPMTSYYDGILGASFQHRFHTALLNQDPPLTQAQIDDVMSVLAGNPASLPGTQDLLNTIYNTTLSDMKAEFALPARWTPGISLAELGNVPPHVQLAWQLDAETRERVGHLTGLVALMPDGPEKQTYLDTLKAVTEALSLMREMIYLMQMKDTDVGAKLNKTQHEAVLAKIDRLQRKMRKMRKKRKKMGKLNPLLEFAKYMMIVMIIVVAVVTCVLLFKISYILIPLMIVVVAVAIAMIITMFTVFNPTEMAMDGVQKLIALLAAEISFINDKAAAILGEIAKYTLFVGLCLGAGPMLGLMYFFQEGSVIEDIAKACGASEMQASIISASVEVAIQIIVLAIVMIILICCTFGAATPFAAAGGAAAIAGLTAKVGASTAAKILTKMLQAIMRFLQTMLKQVARFLEKMAKILQKAIRAVKQVAQTTIRSVKQSINKFLQKLHKTVRRILKILKKVLIKSLKLGPEIAPGVAQGTMSTATSAAQARVSIEQGRIALIQGNLDAFLEEMEAFIQIIKQVADKLLDGLSGFADWNINLGQLQQGLWAGRSSTATNVSQSV